MGDDHECSFVFLIQFSQQGKQGFSGMRIQISRRLVRENQVRVVNERARHGHPLLFPSGQFTGFVVQAVFQTDLRQQRAGVLDTLCDWPFLHQAGQVGVFQGREFRQEVMKLKHEPDAPVSEPGKLLFRQTENILRFIAHGAVRRSIKGAQDMEQGAFPCSRRPKHSQKLPLPDFEIDAFQDVDGLIAQDKRFGQLVHLKKGWG